MIDDFIVWGNCVWTQNVSTHELFLPSLVHRTPTSEKPINPTSESWSIFIYWGKFKMVNFYPNVLLGENSNFPNVVILYTVGKKILYWTTFTIELSYLEIKLSWNISPDVEKEFPILKRNRYSNCVLPFCWNIYFFSFEKSLINKTFKYSKILQIHLGASLRPHIHSFRLWSIHTERGE